MSERQTSLESFFQNMPPPVPIMKPAIGYPAPPVVPVPGPSPLNFPPMNPLQQEAIKAFMESKTKHGMIILSVGTGKTLLALKLWQDLGRPRMLIVVPRIVLIQNPWLSEMEKVGINPRSVGQFYSEEKQIKFPITVTIYNTLALRPDIISRFQFIVCDEADVLAGESFSPILEFVKTVPYVVGLTGTAKDAYRRNPKLEEVLPPLFERTIREAREQKLLAPAEIIPITVQLNPGERSEYENLSEAYRNYMSRAHNSPFPESKMWERRAFMVNQKRLTLLSNAEEKQQEVVNLIAQNPEVPTLVFSSSVPNTESLRRKLNQAGVQAYTITASTEKQRRQQLIKSFGKTFNTLLSVGVLARGYNVPEVSREIFLGATSTSLTAVEQRLGRALRRNPNEPEKVAKIYVIVADRTIDDQLLSRVREAYNRIRRQGT